MVSFIKRPVQRATSGAHPTPKEGCLPTPHVHRIILRSQGGREMHLHDYSQTSSLGPGHASCSSLIVPQASHRGPRSRLHSLVHNRPPNDTHPGNWTPFGRPICCDGLHWTSTHRMITKSKCHRLAQDGCARWPAALARWTDVSDGVG